MAHEIIVEIDSDGNLTSTVQGVDGPSCTQISAWLDKLGEVKEDLNTDDFHKKGKDNYVSVGQ